MVLTLVTLSVIVGSALADISGSFPSYGDCLCADGTGVNVRSTACGRSVIGTINRGQCFTYLGSEQWCSLNGGIYGFFKIRYGQRDGWVAGSYLNEGSDSQCQSQSGRSSSSSGSSVISPSYGACLCADGNGINVRGSACGSPILGSISRGDCYTYLGSQQQCSLGGVRYTFYKIRYGHRYGWVAGSYLKNGSPYDC